MLSKQVESALNEQINKEIYSSYLYLAMAAWCHGQNLPGCAGWLEAQAEEEMVHAMKFYRFVDERGGQIRLQAIDAPPHQWEDPLTLFQDVYAHEQQVTRLILGLVKIAREEVDPATEIFLQWFVTEQVEEEASADQIVQDLTRLKDSRQGLFMIDRELGRRQPASAILNPPAQA